MVVIGRKQKHQIRRHNMKKYKCSQKKEEIITIISEEFAKVLKDLEADHSPENYGRYHAYIDLLQRVKIYEVEE